ncbi:MAG TPA: UbiD family decarboxylase [Burkholderiaceae bacterium]|nr:UbiD family decarboxylase [Burkholderiaceae bacterium]
MIQPGKRTGTAAQVPRGAAKRLVDLQACIAFLEQRGRLVRVRSEVASRFELAGIAKRFEGREAVLFERVAGSAFPVLTGLLWNRETVGELFGMPGAQVPFAIAQAVAAWQKNGSALPGRLLKNAPANQVVEDKVDLARLPIPLHALKDGGRYLDSSLVVARNPLTGAPNISIHRMMVTGKDRLSFLIDAGRHLGEYVEIMERRGQPLPVTINNGIGLAPWIVSTLPRLGDGKNAVAHHLIGRGIDFVRAQTVDVPAYADAQFVIEAEILPGVREFEAPFGEVTGYYGGRDKRWVMRVTAITRRERPVFNTVLSGMEVWNAVGFTAEAAIFHAVKRVIPEVVAVYLPHGGCGFYEAVVQVRNTRAGIGKDVLRETFRAFRSLQRVVVVDIDVDLRDAVDVDWAITTRFNPDRDLVLLPDQEGHILNPMVSPNPDGAGGTVTKMGMDALIPYGAPKERFARVKFREVDLGDYDIVGAAGSA